MTYAEAKKIVGELGLKLSLNREYKEYRVARPGDDEEANAYYTDSLEDAVATADAMSVLG